MKKKILNKITNNNGVSILFALLLFLVVSMVSITIIGASYSSTKRIVSSKNTTQNVLTLSSATLMIKNDLDGKTYNYAGTRGFGNADLFNNELIEISDSVVNNNLINNIQFKIKSSNQSNVDVNISVKQNDNNYLVIFKLVCEDNEEEKMYEAFYLTHDENKKMVSWKYFLSSNKEIK